MKDTKLLPLLMTASVDTRGMAGALYAAQDREKMYVETIRYYLSTICRDPRQKIVFCENSGWNLESVREKVGDTGDAIEYLSLDPNDFDVSRGKGYNEMILMRQAIERSKFIREAGGFFKVTGRYPIYNVGYFVKKASTAIFEKGKQWYCDIKDHSIYDWLHLGWCGHAFDCRLFGVTNDYFLRHLVPLTDECNDYGGMLLEEVLFKAVKAADPKDLVVRFPREPHFGGLAGHHIDAVSWSQKQDCPKEKIKRLVGNCIRIFIPGLKF